MKDLFFVSCTRGRKEETDLYRSLCKLGIERYRFFENNELGLSTRYNSVLEERAGRDEIVVFAHDDVTIVDVYVREKLNEAINELGYCIVGLAGNPNFKIDTDDPITIWTRPGQNLSGLVEHVTPAGLPFVDLFGQMPKRCIVLDGLFLGIDAEKIGNMRFDEAFKFDFYDLDFCLTAHQNGLALGTMNIYVKHRSTGHFRGPRFEEAQRQFRAKWLSTPDSAEATSPLEEVKPPATSDVRPLLECAAEQHVAGDLAAAERSYLSVLALQPDHAAALAGMGAVAGQSGHAAHAAEYLARACALEPANTIFQHNYGEALRQLGQLPLAEASLRRALELDPGFVPARESLIAIVQAAHAQALAARDLRRAETLEWELTRLANNQGNAWLARGGALEAINCYRHSVAIRADYAMAWSNLGNVLREVGQLSEAETACRSAIALDPEFGPAWNNLGNALIEQGRYDEGSPCYEQALAKCADSPEALHNRGSGSLFNRLYLPTLSYAEIAAFHRDWGAAYPVPQNRRWQNSREPDRILRIGYLSPDFREHAMRHFIEPLLARHDASRVEIVCYAQGPRADSHTQRLMDYGHRWEWVHGLNDAELAAQIERDAIDILVDCAGHTYGTRITALAGKPAPIMMSWLGYLCTTGLPAMDYRLTDAWVDPPGPEESPDTEVPLRIPGGMLAYRPHAVSPDPGEPPCLIRGYTTFGSLNNVQKFNRVIVAHWAQLLRALPRAKLLLQSKLLVDPGMVGRIRGMFESFGIQPARLELRPASRDFLRTYHDIDVALDTLPYGGGATTCDALWMGVPVVTLAGKRPAGRLSTSILHRIGRPQWVTDTATAYIDKALELAGKLDALSQIRRDLRDEVRASALCDESAFVRRLEEVYRSAWEQWLIS